MQRTAERPRCRAEEERRTEAATGEKRIDRKVIGTPRPFSTDQERRSGMLRSGRRRLPPSPRAGAALAGGMVARRTEKEGKE